MVEFWHVGPRSLGTDLDTLLSCSHAPANDGAADLALAMGTAQCGHRSASSYESVVV